MLAGRVIGCETYSISLNDAHVMSIYPEKECCECTGVDDPQTVCLSRDEWKGCVLVEAHRGCHPRGAAALHRWKVRGVVDKVHETGVCCVRLILTTIGMQKTIDTGDRFSTTRIRNADEFLDEDVVFEVVPIPKNDGVFIVIGVDFCARVDDKRTPEAIDVLTLGPRKRSKDAPWEGGVTFRQRSKYLRSQEGPMER